ncbi:MAG: hypothetical protein A2W35_22055 [Chloroflexi bacterium RBG_16_57_11]|nr:MAG: hypothetical protein A2W35_22055 [Chloroflexi bacterium RBG_16_57_11]
MLQALTNIYAEKFREMRQPLIGRAVFSNWLSRRNESDFFMSDWQHGYKSFRHRLIEGFENGYTWVADFDLAAFYETIPHDLLIKMLIPRSEGTEFYNTLLSWFQVWSSDEKSARHGHGIPQGPLASSFLAECILLPVDQKMAKTYRYYRYVDDIRILGKTELEIQQAVVYLDILCRERGLIPNTDKTEFRQVTTAEELVMGMPQIIGYVESGMSYQLDLKEAENLVFKSVEERDQLPVVIDRSKLRFSLFRAPTSPAILKLILSLWNHYPQHVDAFVAFLENYQYVEDVVILCTELLLGRYPYDYVRGEMWKLLARMCGPGEMDGLIELAIETVKNTKKGSAARIGAYIFLCSCDKNGMGAYSKWLIGEKSSIIQSVTAPYLNVDRTHGKEAAIQFLNRSLADPSLGLTRTLVDQGVTLDELGKSRDELPLVVQNVYFVAGIIPNPTGLRKDLIGQILAKRYHTIQWNKWKRLLAGEYPHCLMILRNAEAYYKNQFTPWLSFQDSFNDSLFRAFQIFLALKGAPGAIAVRDSGGLLIDYGRLINDSNFKSAYPILSTHLQSVHNRRSKLPSSHPYDKYTGTKALPLKKYEQRQLTAALGAAYNEIIRIVETIGM